jgi:hypothetical protein
MFDFQLMNGHGLSVGPVLESRRLFGNLFWTRLWPVTPEPDPERLITDAHFTYPELRDLDDALARLGAAGRAVDVAVRSMSAPSINSAYADLRASVAAHRATSQRILSALHARAPR